MVIQTSMCYYACWKWYKSTKAMRAHHLHCRFHAKAENAFPTVPLMSSALNTRSARQS